MNFDIHNIPPVIQGTAPQPVQYGKSAHAQYRGYFKAVEDEFVRHHNAVPLEQLTQASIRYTPEGTIAKGQVTEEAIDNALGYAAADIEAFDQNGDQALDRQEVLSSMLQPFQMELDRTEHTLTSEEATTQEKEEAQQYRDLDPEFCYANSGKLYCLYGYAGFAHG